MSGSRKILLAQTKGGVGKTTTTIEIAGYFVSRGQSVAVVDTDPSGNAFAWAAAYGRVLRLHQPVEDIRAWRTMVTTLLVAVVVIDSPPRMDANLGATVALADDVLVPVGISVWEQQGAAEVVAIAAAANRLRPIPIRLALVPTRIDARLREGRLLIDELGELRVPISPEIGLRILHARAAACGETILENAPWSSAAAEIIRLGDWLIKFGERK
jgi:chromosome partitioning protein